MGVLVRVLDVAREPVNRAVGERRLGPARALILFQMVFGCLIVRSNANANRKTVTA